MHTLEEMSSIKNENWIWFTKQGLPRACNCVCVYDAQKNDTARIITYSSSSRLPTIEANESKYIIPFTKPEKMIAGTAIKLDKNIHKPQSSEKSKGTSSYVSQQRQIRTWCQNERRKVCVMLKPSGSLCLLWIIQASTLGCMHRTLLNLKQIMQVKTTWYDTAMPKTHVWLLFELCSALLLLCILIIASHHEKFQKLTAIRLFGPDLSYWSS